jgi:hypothetical protein
MATRPSSMGVRRAIEGNPFMSVQPSPPASTTAATVRCRSCDDVVVEIEMVIDGAPLTMRSCSTCDSRSWHRGGAEIELGGVLADLSRAPTRYRRDLANR